MSAAKGVAIAIRRTVWEQAKVEARRQHRPATAIVERAVRRKLKQRTQGVAR